MIALPPLLFSVKLIVSVLSPAVTDVIVGAVGTIGEIVKDVDPEPK